MRIPRIPLLAIGAAALVGGVSGYAYATSTTLPVVQSVTTPAPVTLDTVGVVRLDATPVPTGYTCDDGLYVTVSGKFAGDVAVSGVCIDPGVLAHDRVAGVANAMGTPPRPTR